jgi:TonB-linked SusC/RagA family outer membrane protein
LLLVADVSAQERRITLQGQVSDDEGRPLPGVSIRVTNTTLGTASGVDGSYDFNFPTTRASVTVEYSFVGFKTERRQVSESGTINLVLQPDILRISEVVVTGTTGLTERKQLGNTISSVGGSEIAGSGAVDASGALSGKITGALVTQTSGSPAGAISVKLRGNSTINSGSEPLYIVDGVIVDNSSNELVLVGSGGVQNRLVDLNPADIDRIEVIKGAAAAAIYGSRASNGVVQIFTKRGKSGAPTVTYSTSVMMSQVRKTVKVNDSPVEWVDPTDNTNLATRPVERFDYQDYIFDDGYGTDQFVSVSGGSDRTSYYISGSHKFNEGIIRNSDFQRTTLRVNVGQTLSDWAFVNVGTNLTRSFSNDIPTGGESFFDGAITTIQFLPHNGSAEPDELGNYSAPGTGNAFFGNPFEVIDTYEFTQEINRFTGSVNLNLTPYEGLSVDLITGYDTYGQVSRGFKPVGGVAVPNGFTRRGDITRKLYNIDLNVKYATPITDDVESTTAVGGTYQYDKAESIINEANNLGPIVQTIDGGTIVASSDFVSERAVRGGYIQQTFGYRDRIFLTGAGRIDGSSVFGEDNNTQFYPKVSGAWVLSEESFWEGLSDAVGTFKLRASWGKSGNLTGIGPFERFTNYNPVSFGGQTGLIPSTSLGNADIKPETQKELEVGADFSILKNRVGVEFTYYDQTVDDLLLSRVLSPSTGASTRIENVGQLTNKGIEVMVRGVVVRKEDLDVNVTAMFSRNRNNVTSLAGGSRFGIGGFGSQYAIEDQPLGVFYWRAYARDDNGDILLTPGGLPQAERGDQALQIACEIGDTSICDPNDSSIRRDSDGNLTGAQRDASGQPTGGLLRLVVGDPNPDWTGSVITDVNYKQWGFRMQWDAVQGGDIMNWNRRNFDRHNYRGGYDYGLEEQGLVTKGTANAKGSGLILEEYVEDGSFIKLREIAVSYTLMPKTRVLRSVRLTLSGRNLLSIDDYKNYDPEVTISGRNTGVRGFDFGTVPIPRTYSLGATLTF